MGRVRWVGRVSRVGFYLTNPTYQTHPTTDLAVRRLRELLEEFRLALLDFLARQIFLVRGDRPAISLRVDDHAAAVAPELIGELSHRPGRNLRARGNGAVEERVAILHVHPQRGG